MNVRLFIFVILIVQRIAYSSVILNAVEESNIIKNQYKKSPTKFESKHRLYKQSKLSTLICHFLNKSSGNIFVLILRQDTTLFPSNQFEPLR